MLAHRFLISAKTGCRAKDMSTIAGISRITHANSACPTASKPLPGCLNRSEKADGFTSSFSARSRNSPKRMKGSTSSSCVQAKVCQINGGSKRWMLHEALAGQNSCLQWQCLIESLQQACMQHGMVDGWIRIQHEPDFTSSTCRQLHDMRYR